MHQRQALPVLQTAKIPDPLGSLTVLLRPTPVTGSPQTRGVTQQIRHVRRAHLLGIATIVDEGLVRVVRVQFVPPRHGIRAQSRELLQGKQILPARPAARVEAKRALP